MAYLWLALIALLACGWAALDGAGTGAALVAPRVAPTVAGRRRLLTAYGPFLLPNEMWLVALVGLLAAVNAAAEARLLSGLYAVVVPLLAAWVLRDAAIWLRGRRPGAVWRRVWDRVLVAAGAAFAVCAGVLLGDVAQGLPSSGTVPAVHAYGPFPLLCGVTMAALFAVHGAVFVRVRLDGDAAARAAATVRRLAPYAAGLSLVAVAASLLTGPSAAAVLALAAPLAVLGARTWVADRPGRALACGAVAVAAPVAAVLAGASGPLLASMAASPIVTALLPPALAVTLLYQAWLWWLFRRPVDARAAVFF